MGNDTKWADVAHYYQFADIEIQIGIGQRKFKGVSQHDSVRGGAKRALFADSGGIFVRSTQYEISEYKPILRHLDDMAEADAREIYRLVWGFDLDISVSMWDSGIDYFESLYGRYHSAVFTWLISRGFDVFGLIESGQAIRKEASNG